MKRVSFALRHSVSALCPLAVVGLGYVGLPLACAFARAFQSQNSRVKSPAVIGFDINARRIESLQSGHDWTGEIASRDLKNRCFEFTANPSRLRECKCIIVTVPTPVDNSNEPDLTPLQSASEIVGRNLTRGTIVIYESTVYPGVTEEVCLPILEKYSGLKLGDFKIGYSPERINPGDKEHTIDKITKVVSGCDPKTLSSIASLYSLVAPAIHQAPNIKTAEAAKVIENVQRDLNIALMNELSLIFGRLGIHTQDVLSAAATKWNFQRFHPGLVGGHCIGVDPYYLTHRARQLGYHPAVILAGRAINDAMSAHVGDMLVRSLTQVGKNLKKHRVLFLGLTFKENVPDIRNSKIADTIKYLRALGITCLGCDPLLTPETIEKNFGIGAVKLSALTNPQSPIPNPFAAAVLVNAHRAFSRLTLAQLKRVMSQKPILVDLKNFFDRPRAEKMGFHVQTL